MECSRKKRRKALSILHSRPVCETWSGLFGLTYYFLLKQNVCNLVIYTILLLIQPCLQKNVSFIKRSKFTNVSHAFQKRGKGNWITAEAPSNWNFVGEHINCKHVSSKFILRPMNKVLQGMIWAKESESSKKETVGLI